MATRTTSPVRVSAAPPAAGSTVSSTPVSVTLDPVTLEPSLKVMPCFVRARWKAVARSESMPGVMRGRYSTTVTSAPRRRQTEPSSSPMMPAPTTISFLGTAGRLSAPVESTTLPSTNSTPGRGVGSEPVAMTMFLAFSVVFDPSAASTSTLPGPAIVPLPLIQSTLFFLNRNSMPLVRAVTLSFLAACIWPRFSLGVTSMPILANSVLADSNSSEACSSALDGMQPTFRQVPPRVPRISMQAAFSPSCPARIAAL